MTESIVKSVVSQRCLERLSSEWTGHYRPQLWPTRTFLPGGHVTAENLWDASSFSHVSFVGGQFPDFSCRCLTALDKGCICGIYQLFSVTRISGKTNVSDKSLRSIPQGVYTFGVASSLEEAGTWWCIHDKGKEVDRGRPASTTEAANKKKQFFPSRKRLTTHVVERSPIQKKKMFISSNNRTAMQA